MFLKKCPNATVHCLECRTFTVVDTNVFKYILIQATIHLNEMLQVFSVYSFLVFFSLSRSVVVRRVWHLSECQKFHSIYRIKILSYVQVFNSSNGAEIVEVKLVKTIVKHFMRVFGCISCRKQ